MLRVSVGSAKGGRASCHHYTSYRKSAQKVSRFFGTGERGVGLAPFTLKGLLPRAMKYAPGSTKVLML